MTDRNLETTFTSPRLDLTIYDDYELNFVLKQETEWEIETIYKAQKAMDYIIEAINIGEW